MTIQIRETRIGILMMLLVLLLVVGTQGRSLFSGFLQAEVVSQVAEERIVGILPGMMLPYFGAGQEPPAGYVWADGKAQWPDADWVPSHLRGHQVPAMHGHLLGSAMEATDLGSAWTNGTIAVTGKVEGGDLKLPATQPGESPGSFWALNTGPGWLVGTGLVQIFERIVLSNNVPQLLGAKGRAAVVQVDFPPPAVFTSDRIQGTANLREGVGRLNTSESLPPHIRCRWIIRMR